MADKLKALSKFTEDALALAIRQLPESERINFERGLQLLENTLGAKEKKAQNSKQLNDETIFRNSIIPQIERRVKQIEEMELKGMNHGINIEFDLKTSFDGYTYTQLKTEHKNVVTLETGLKSLTLLAQFSRGMIYISLTKICKSEGQNWKNITTNELGISYMTALRYMTLAALIANYPRLICCELSFTQILKHKSRLLQYLKSEEGRDLESALSLAIEIKAQDKPVFINRTILEIPTTKFPTDPDYLYRDSLDKREVPETVNQWMGASAENEEAELTDVMQSCSLKTE